MKYYDIHAVKNVLILIAIARYPISGEYILYFIKFQQIGTYDKSSLMLGNTKFMTAYKNTESSCPGKCVQCKSVSRKSEEFTYIPGDVILAGLYGYLVAFFIL